MINGWISGVQKQKTDQWKDQWRADARNCDGGVSGVQTQETVMAGSVVSSRLAQWPSYEV
jgi:hypothetical protein